MLYRCLTYIWNKLLAIFKYFSVYLEYKIKLDFNCPCPFITNQTVESHIEVVVRSKEGDGKPQTGVLSANDHCLSALGNLGLRSERTYHILQLP